MSSDDRIEEFVLSVIADMCNQERSSISDSANIFDLGLESLKLTILAARIEAEFECQVGGDGLMRLLQSEAVADVVALTREWVSSAAG